MSSKQAVGLRLKTRFTWLLALPSLAVYLPSLLVYFVHPGQWWPMGYLSIGFPVSWFCFLPATMVVFWLKKPLGMVMLLLLLAGIPIMKNCWGMHPAKNWVENKQANTLRVMQWNCMDLIGADPNQTQDLPLRSQAVAFIRLHQPDVILIQDFSDYRSDVIHSNIALLQDSLGYRYMSFKPHYEIQKPWGYLKAGVAVFSKMPMVQTGYLPYPGRKFPEFINWADIVFHGKSIRFVSTHLQSMNLRTQKNEPPALDYFQWEDSAIIRSGSRFTKMTYYQPYHVREATVLRRFLDTCSVPVLLGADLNSVPSSYVYQLVKGNRKDAFLACGWGFGKSFHSRLPSLRIDYLFTAPEFEILQSCTFPVRFSDHYPVISDLQLR